MAPHPFLTEIKKLRSQTHTQIEQGALTDAYGTDHLTALELLNDALATELDSILRYKHYLFMATELDAKDVAAEFQQHAAEEPEQAERRPSALMQLNK